MSAIVFRNRAFRCRPGSISFSRVTIAEIEGKEDSIEVSLWYHSTPIYRWESSDTGPTNFASEPGTCNLFVACEPVVGKRYLQVTEHRTKVDFARFIRDLVDVYYPTAEKIVLVMDNLNTHTPAALYEVFEPAEARRLAEKLELHYTPKHGSWLNMAEIEFSILSRQCLDRRIGSQAELAREVAAWQAKRNGREVGINWRFTTADARIKLKHLYPSIAD